MTSADSPRGLRKSREQIRVAVVGGVGAYSATAAAQYFGAKWRATSLEIEGQEGLPQIFERVAAGLVDYGLVPVENSVSGTMFDAYDLLLSTPEVHVVGDTALYHEHCLLALPGVCLEDVRQVVSHPHVLQQCSSYLAALPRSADGAAVVQRTASNTVAACQALREAGARDTAVVASQEAGRLFQLEVLAPSISAPQEVVTRYLIVGKSPAPIEQLGEPLKCSIAVTISNVAGALFKTTACFALRDINISKFECAPAPAYRLRPGTAFQQPFFWQYVFFIDFEPSSPSLALTAIAHLQEFALSVRTFGLYHPQSIPVTPSKADWTSFI